MLEHLANIIADEAKPEEENMAQEEDNQLALALITTSTITAAPLSTTPFRKVCLMSYIKSLLCILVS